MRKRERLTSFFIIFILLTFSAYSNSMNVGGRIGQTNNQIVVAKNNNRTQIEQELDQNSNDKNLNTSINKDKNEIKNQININDKANASEFNNDDSGFNRDSKDRKIESSLNFKRDYMVIKEQRKENNKSEQEDKKQEDKKTNFEKRHEPQLIDQIQVHKVRSGETLWDIAHKHGLNIDTLIGANNISNMNSIKPGQEFKILPVKGIIYRVSPGESVSSIARKFNLKVETIMEDNNLDDPSNLKIDQNLILRGAKPEFSYQDRLDQKFMYPCSGRISSYYGPRWGRMHEGLDFAVPVGSPIRAVSSGRVVYSGWATGYGYVVIIEHQKGLRTLYAHNSKLLVRERESVGKGEVIARSGNTGNSTGPHLHFEVQVNGRPENPLDYIHK